MPVFVMLLGCAFVAIVLNVFPLTAFLFLLLLGPWWPGLFLNLAVVSMAVEAWTGSIPRIFLLAPLLWFGGSLAMHWLARSEAAALDAELVAFNANAKGLALQSPSTLTFLQTERETGLSPESFVTGYNISTIYRARARPLKDLSYSIVDRSVGLARGALAKIGWIIPTFASAVSS